MENPLLLAEVNGLSLGAAGLVLTPGAVAWTSCLRWWGGAPTASACGPHPRRTWGLWRSRSCSSRRSPALLAVATAGLACVQSTASNAAANALPGEAGLGWASSRGAFFLGAGDAGPALIGAVLAVQQATGAAAPNPLYGFGAAPFSDAFLAMVLALAAALVVAFGLPTTPATSATSRQSGPR